MSREQCKITYHQIHTKNWHPLGLRDDYKAIEWILPHHVSLYHYITKITTQGLEVQEISASGKFILHHLDLSLASDPFA